jgi:TonB-linked SusC/RagA family outer membrane protein
MRKILSLLTVLVLISVLATAQTRLISGQVKDEQGEPIPFATVTIKGTKQGVTTDANGNFRISVKPGDVLVFSAVGAESSESAVGTSDLLSATLKKTGALQEVVVTALGVQRPAKELGYATTRIRSSELNQAKTVNLQNGLTGKVSGLNITTVNSGVFEESKINLRGLRSLTGNNQPLLVIDNIPTPLSYIYTINPNDVQDVNVLKGASAAAIYGPDGVNGVILVRTRRGASGKPVVNVSHTVQLARVSFMPKVQKRFGGGTSEDQYGRTIYDPIENQQFGPEFDGTMKPIGPELEGGDQQMVRYSANDDRKKFWNNGLTLQTDVSFGGQGFYFSAQDADIKGLMPKDKNRRTSFRLNGSKEYGKLKVIGNINYIQNNYDVVNDGAYSSRFPSSYNGSTYFTVLNTPAHIPLTSYKDMVNNKYAQYSNYYNEYFVNPYWVIDNHRTKSRTDNFLTSAEANYSFAEWLHATYRLGAALSFSSFKNENGPVITTDYAQDHRGQQYDPQPSSVGDGENYTSRVTHEFFLNGRQEVSDFAFNYILGTRYRQNDAKYLNVAGNNLQIAGLYNNSIRLGEAGVSELNYRTRLFSVFGQLSASYKGWANIEFSAANDWDSRLNPDMNSYFYPGVSASVVLSEALPFLQESKILSYLKIRGAVSKSANVNLGRADNAFTGAYALQPIYNATGGFPYGNMGGFSAGNIFTDPNIEPEFVNSREIGFEIGFLKNRFNLDVTYFNQKNTNQILEVQQSPGTGYSSYVDNAADFKNYGVEMDLNITPVVKLGQVNINLSMNATYNNNEVIGLFPGINELAIGGTNQFTQIAASSPDAYNYAIVGQPAFVFKLSDYKRDPQGRVIVNKSNGYPELQDSLVTRGRSLPTWIVGINPSISWKGLTLGMTWDYRGGHNVYHGIGSDMDFTGISARSAQFGRERFVFPNSVVDDGTGKYVPNENIQVASGGRNFWATGTTNTSVGTNYFTSAAFWKLRELAIAYELPFKWIGEKQIIKRVVVSFVGRNLWTILPDSNQWTDPEFNYTTTNNTFGINSTFSTPPARTFGASLNMTF